MWFSWKWIFSGKFTFTNLLISRDRPKRTAVTARSLGIFALIFSHRRIRGREADGRYGPFFLRVTSPQVVATWATRTHMFIISKHSIAPPLHGLWHPRCPLLSNTWKSTCAYDNRLPHQPKKNYRCMYAVKFDNFHRVNMKTGQFWVSANMVKHTQSSEYGKN